ncbi:MAG: peptide deformylase [Defluviitaleaceae bacterium]|nr:peptide deformylase [Defluviitaleaceae bacterium]
MALRRIRQYGDDILKKKSKPVVKFDETLHNLLDDMWETMHEFDGLGMAAPQVGVLRRAIILETEEEQYELINPVIVETDGQDVKTEACLSVPNKQGDVERPMFVKVEAYDRHENPVTIATDDDMLVTALCHEIDHLDGILFIEKATNIQPRPTDEEVAESNKRIKGNPRRALKILNNKDNKKDNKKVAARA